MRIKYSVSLSPISYLLSPVSCLLSPVFSSGNLLSHLNTKILHSLHYPGFAYDFANGGCRSDRVNLKSLIPDHHSVDLLNANRWNRQLLRNPQSQVSWDMLNTTANAPASSSAIASAKILLRCRVLPCPVAELMYRLGCKTDMPHYGNPNLPDGRLFVPLLDIPLQLHRLSPSLL